LKSEKRVAKNLFVLSSAELVSRGLQFYLAFYLAPILGATAYGLLGFAKSHIAFYVLAVTLGMDVYGTREISRNKDKVKDLVDNIMSMRLLFSLLAYAVLVVVVIFFFNESYETKLLFLIAGTNIFSSAFLLNWVYQGLEKMGVMALRQIISSVLNLIGILIFVLSPSDLMLAMIIMQGTLILNTVWMLMYYFKHYGRIKFTYNKEKWNTILKTSFSIGLSYLIVTIYNTLDMNMLGFILGDKHPQNGLYYFAHNILLAVLIPTNIIQSAFYPQFAKEKTQQDMRNMFRTYSKLTYSLGAFLSMMTFVFAKEITLLLKNEEFLPAEGLIQILSITVFIIYITVTFYSPLIAWGFEKKCLYANIAGLIINAIANAIFIPYYGMFAAATATIASEFLVLLVMGWYFYKVMGILYLDKLLLYILCGVLIVSPGYIIKYYFDMPITALIISLALFLPVNLMFKTITISGIKRLIDR